MCVCMSKYYAKSISNRCGFSTHFQQYGSYLPQRSGSCLTDIKNLHIQLYNFKNNFLICHFNFRLLLSL